MTPADMLDRVKAALSYNVGHNGGEVMLATDEAEAIFKAVRYVGKKWLCILYTSGGETGSVDHARKGMTEARLHIAVIQRPQLTADRAAGAVDAESDASLLSRWEMVRGLMTRVRFGTLTLDTPAAGKYRFEPRPGYLDGHKMLPMMEWRIERRTYETTEPSGITKGMKELLWGSLRYRVHLAMPVYAPADEPGEQWICI
jgi:hypothetical protein